MKKWMLAAMLTLSTSVFAYADDCCGQGSFDGIYIGGNVGVLSHTSYRNDLDGFLTDNSGWSAIKTGVAGGIQLGYDWQCQNTVLGFVADWQKASVSHKLRDNPNADSDNFHRAELDWFTTIRGRAGLAISDALVYVTGGAVVADFNYKWNDSPDLLKKSKARWGWTAGVGTEFKVTCNLSLGVEFLFMEFDSHDIEFVSASSSRFRFNHSDSAWLGRLTLNYRFGDLLGCCW